MRVTFALVFFILTVILPFSRAEVWFKVPEQIDPSAGHCISEGCSVEVYNRSQVPSWVLERDSISVFSPGSVHYIRIDSDQAKFTGYGGAGAARAWAQIHDTVNGNPVAENLIEGFHALTNAGIALSMIVDGSGRQELESKLCEAFETSCDVAMPAISQAAGFWIQNLPLELSYVRMRGEAMLYHSVLRHPARVQALRQLYELVAERKPDQTVYELLGTAIESLNSVDCLHCRLFAALDLVGLRALVKDGELDQNESLALAYVRQHAFLVNDALEERVSTMRRSCPPALLQELCMEPTHASDVFEVCDCMASN